MISEVHCFDKMVAPREDYGMIKPGFGGFFRAMFPDQGDVYVTTTKAPSPPSSQGVRSSGSSKRSSSLKGSSNNLFDDEKVPSKPKKAPTKPLPSAPRKKTKGDSKKTVPNPSNLNRYYDVSSRACDDTSFNRVCEVVSSDSDDSVAKKYREVNPERYFDVATRRN